MKRWRVCIKAIVTKDIFVDAKYEEEACEIAHGEFSVLLDGNPEKYEQNTVYCQEMP